MKGLPNKTVIALEAAVAKSTGRWWFFLALLRIHVVALVNPSLLLLGFVLDYQWLAGDFRFRLPINSSFHRISRPIFANLVRNKTMAVSGKATAKYFLNVVTNVERSLFILKRLVMKDKGANVIASHVSRARLRFCSKAFLLSSIDITAVTTAMILSALTCRFWILDRRISKSFWRSCTWFPWLDAKFSRLTTFSSTSETRVPKTGNLLLQLWSFWMVTCKPPFSPCKCGFSISHSSCLMRVVAYFAKVYHSAQTIMSVFLKRRRGSSTIFAISSDVRVLV